MKKIALFIASFATGFAIFFGIAISTGNNLPPIITGSETVNLPLSTDLVWNIISDFNSYQHWNTAFLTSSVVGETTDGYPRWDATFKSQQKGTFDVIEYVPLKVLAYQLTGTQRLHNVFRIELTQNGSGTLLTATQELYVDSPLNRFVSQKLMGPIIAKRYAKDIELLVKRIQTGQYEIGSNVYSK